MLGVDLDSLRLFLHVLGASRRCAGWDLLAEHVEDRSSAYRTTLALKLAVVVLSGVAAWLHARSATRRGRASWGALSGLGALAALLLGVVLAG